MARYTFKPAKGLDAEQARQLELELGEVRVPPARKPARRRPEAVARELEARGARVLAGDVPRGKLELVFFYWSEGGELLQTTLRRLTMAQRDELQRLSAEHDACRLGREHTPGYYEGTQRYFHDRREKCGPVWRPREVVFPSEAE